MRFVLLAFTLNIISRVSFAYATFSTLGKWAVYIANPLSVLVGAITIMTAYRYQKNTPLDSILLRSYNKSTSTEV